MSYANRRAEGEGEGEDTHLVEPCNALRCERTPGQEHNAAAATSESGSISGQIRATVFVHDVDDLVGELFPTSVRMGRRFACFHSQARVQEQHAVLRP